MVPDKAKKVKATKDKSGKNCCEHPSKRNGRWETHRFLDGSTKWEVEWAKKQDVPAEGYVDFLLGFPAGLTFTKQPPLTQQEIDQGNQRPDNVVNSYAVYWPQAGRFLMPDGSEINNYETGKFAHVFRPNLIDDAGNWTWIDQTAIVNGGTKLRVYLDSAWLAGATFPVRLDPTFGYSTLGGTGGYFGQNYLGAHDRDTPADSGTADSITMYCYANSGTTSVTFGIWSNSSNKPATLLADTGASTVTTTPGWVTLNLDSGLSVAAGTLYWLGQNHSATELWFRFDSTGTRDSYYESKTYSAGSLSSFSAPSGWGLSNRTSIYATYTVAASGFPFPLLYRNVAFSPFARRLK